MLIVPAVIGYLVAFFQIIREPASTSPAHPPDFNPVPAALPNVLYPSIQDSNKDTTPLLQNTAGKINCYYFNNPEPLTHRTLIRSRLRYPNVLYLSIQDSNKDTKPLLQNTAGKINCFINCWAIGTPLDHTKCNFFKFGKQFTA